MRLYNGCPDKELQELLDSRRETKRKIISLGFTVTYFPMEEKYIGFRNYTPVTEFCDSLQDVLKEVKNLNREDSHA